MTEATERERRHETDEAETDMRYPDETLNNETGDRDAYDRDRDVDGVGETEGAQSYTSTSYDGPDEAQTRTDEAEQELADRDQARSDLDSSEVDRPDLERSMDRAEAARADDRAGELGASDPAQPGTVPAGPGYPDRAGYDAVASRDPVASHPDGGDVSVVDDPDTLMKHWQEVQTGFVDDPRQAVQDADGLVQQVMQQVGQRLASERAGLEQVWSRGGDVSTEDLRQALRQYRSFFNRLLHV